MQALQAAPSSTEHLIHDADPIPFLALIPACRLDVYLLIDGWFLRLHCTSARWTARCYDFWYTVAVGAARFSR